jgi:SWI/SNF chromatin-remodeling complex subunit SWI1
MSVPSVPGWLPDSSAITNSAFSSPDPSGLHSFDSSSPGILSQPALDPNQFHHQQRAQLQNGGSRTSSPGFQAPAYNVNSVVPLKRPRPHEDSMSISPRPHPQGLPTSRSQTPLAHNQQQLAYQIYQTNQQQQPPQRQYTPIGYNSSHLQHVGSANASPSPVMQAQPFNPQGNSGGPPVPKRLSTQSPSPFSPAPTQQGFMPQGSPPPPNHTPRVGTPQSNGNMGVAPPSHPPYSQGFTQGFSSPAATASASPTPVSQGMGQNPNMHAQLVYQMRQQQAQQQQQQQRYMQQNQQQPQGMGMQPGPPNSMSMQSSQMNQGPMGPNQMNPNQMQRPNSQGPVMPGGRLSDPNQFMKSLYDYMQKRGTPIQGYPYIGSKPVSLVNLYGTVLKLGGSQRVGMENRWQQVAMSLGFSPDQYPGSAEELARIFRNNLAPYEDAWMRSQREAQQKRQMQQSGA